MNRMMSVACALLLAVAGAGAHAQWTGSLAYLNFDDDVDLDAVLASVGYRLEERDNFFLIPELRAGFGLGSDTVPAITTQAVEVEIDRLLGVSNRAQYEFDTGIYLFVSVSYVNYRFEAKTTALDGTRTSSRDDAWEWGVGGGLGFQFTDMFGAEGAWERVNGADVFTGGLRIRF